MARYELKSGKSSKFWEVKLVGATYTTTYGRIGTKGQSTTKTASSVAQAKKECERLVASKLAKGYKKVNASSSKKTVSKKAMATNSSPTKPASKRTRAKAGTLERAYQDAVTYTKKTVSPGSGGEPIAGTQESMVWHLEDRKSSEPQFCTIEVRDKTLRMTWGQKATAGETCEETFMTSEQAGEAGLLLAGNLLQGTFDVIKPSKRKETKAERVCASIVREIGKRKLEDIGSIAEQVTEDDSGQAASELLDLHSHLNHSPKKFFELIAVASGAELADMGQRGGFLMNVVTSESPDEDDVDALVIDAISYVDIYTFWDSMFGSVTKILLRNKRIRKALPDLSENEKGYYFDTMEASFCHFVRPRLVEAIKRYR